MSDARELELRMVPSRVVEGRLHVSATLHSPRGTRELCYTLDERERDAVVGRADPFLVASVTLAMHEGCDVRVRGAPVSSSLLQNLDEFQQVWHAWYGLPMCGLVAEEECEDQPRSASSVVAFSGGVDSAFSAYRHATGRVGHARDLRSGMMIHGVDIPRADTAGFVAARARSRRMLASVGLELLTVETNAWELAAGTSHFVIPGIASALHLLGGRFGAGLVPSTASYRALALPLDSTPLSDWMLGGASFAVVHDGAAYNRLEKVRALLDWDEAMTSLRVCFAGPQRDRNCGRCPKCMLTLLAFEALGAAPRCFDSRPSDTEKARWAARFPDHKLFVAEAQALVDEAAARGLRASWVKPMSRRLRVLRAKQAARYLSPTLAHRGGLALRELGRLRGAR